MEQLTKNMDKKTLDVKVCSGLCEVPMDVNEEDNYVDYYIIWPSPIDRCSYDMPRQAALR
eukprot:13395201-Heterocapsa_arctica.AAC.1